MDAIVATSSKKPPPRPVMPSPKPSVPAPLKIEPYLTNLQNEIKQLNPLNIHMELSAEMNKSVDFANVQPEEEEEITESTSLPAQAKKEFESRNYMISIIIHTILMLSFFAFTYLYATNETDYYHGNYNPSSHGPGYASLSFICIFFVLILDAYLFQTKFVITKFFRFMSVRHLKVKYFVYKYVISMIFLLSTTIGSILFFIGITCEFNQGKCVLYDNNDTSYYAVISVIFSMGGSFLMYIGSVSLIAKYENASGIKKVYDLVGYIHLCILIIVFYFHFMGPGVFTFVFYSWNSFSFNSNTNNASYFSLPYSDYWFYFASYLFYCMCGLSMYVYYYTYYQGDRAHPIRNAIKIGFPILLPVYDYFRKPEKTNQVSNTKLSDAIFRLYLKFKHEKRQQSLTENGNELDDHDEEEEEQKPEHQTSNAVQNDEQPRRTIYERFGHQTIDDKNHLTVKSKTANVNKSKASQFLTTSISLLNPWQKREDRINDLKKIAVTVGSIITSGSKDKQTVTPRWDDNSIVKLMVFIDEHERLQTILPIIGVLLLSVSPLMSCFVRVYETGHCYRNNAYEQLIVYYGFIINLFFAQRMFKFFKSVNSAFIRSLSVAEVILEHDLQQIRNELNQVAKLADVEHLEHEHHKNYEEVLKEAGTNVMQEESKKGADYMKNEGLKKAKEIIKRPKTAQELFSHILEKMLHWNTSIFSQIKIICAQVKKLELSIALLLIGILASTGFLSLVFLSSFYFHLLNQVWWQLFLFNSGLIVNMVKIIYDIAQVGGNFITTVQSFENIFVGEHFKFNKEFQEQFEKIFHIHSNLASKWRNDGVKIKIFNKEIDFKSVTNLLLLLLSQGFVFVFNYVYVHVLKPFFTAK